MRHKAIIHCEICGKTILEGERLYYDNGAEVKDDGVDGEYFEGGECAVCGRRLCDTCGGFDQEGLCTGCRAEEEKKNTGHYADHLVSA
jgi:hypothetical protein